MKGKTLSGFFKFLTILVLILGVIGSISAAVEARTFWVFLLDMIIIGLFSMIFLAFSEIFAYLDQIDSSVETNRHILETIREKLEEKDDKAD